ncbi:hypothetical protein ASG07_15365 [Sphingomonas sp. Leaf343]|nr:hypothetical protein ASG07_15365 [Sphingomonas sp. Leaf343]
MLNPVAINSSNVIVDGHLRVEIAHKLGLRTVPVIRIAHMSDAELRAYAIAANKLPAVANYDINALRIELDEIRAEIPTINLTLTGFTIGEMDRITGNHQAGIYDDLDEDEVPPAPVEVSARRGDLYALGKHRLICGDSLDPMTLTTLMDGELATCCFTDPPYNVKINGHVSGTGRHAEFAMASGEMTRSDFETFLITALENIAGVLTNGAIAFVCMDHAHIGELLMAGDAVFDERLNICVWDKGRGGMGSLWRSQHELIAVFKTGDGPHINAVELGRHGRNRTNLWSFPGMTGFGRGKKKALELHPTVKPVALVAEALLDVTDQGQVVLDPFGGSGSTLIAAERIQRRARLVEFDPVYVDRIIARWEKLTGGKAELLSRDDSALPDLLAGEAA